jgi:hypothetical protein
LRKYLADPGHVVNDEIIESNPDLNYAEKLIQIIDREMKELRQKTNPYNESTLEPSPGTRCNLGNRGKYKADKSRIIPKCNLNFEDEISFKKGRVVTPAFWRNARVKMWVRLCEILSEIKSQ